MASREPDETGAAQGEPRGRAEWIAISRPVMGHVIRPAQECAPAKCRHASGEYLMRIAATVLSL
ncbi:hypothetical protein [Bosea sp. NPDC055594]